MLFKRCDAQKFEIKGGAKGVVYPSSPKGDQTIAYVEQDGVYRKQGFSMNDVCTETIVMLDGSFEIECDGVKYKLEAGDIFVILPGKKYRIRGRGKSFDFITPAWNKKQNRIMRN